MIKKITIYWEGQTANYHKYSAPELGMDNYRIYIPKSWFPNSITGPKAQLTLVVTDQNLESVAA